MTSCYKWVSLSSRSREIRKSWMRNSSSSHRKVMEYSRPSAHTVLSRNWPWMSRSMWSIQSSTSMSWCATSPDWITESNWSVTCSHSPRGCVRSTSLWSTQSVGWRQHVRSSLSAETITYLTTYSRADIGRNCIQRGTSSKRSASWETYSASGRGRLKRQSMTRLYFFRGSIDGTWLLDLLTF